MTVDNQGKPESGDQGASISFDPKELFPGKVHKFALNREDFPCMRGTKLFIFTSDSGEIQEMAFQRTDAPTLFLGSDGSVREVSQNAGIVVTEVAKPAKGYDCEAAVRWAVFYGGLNSAFAGCVAAMCKAVNCRHFGKCGGQSQFELDLNVRYHCSLELSRE